jgi:hypothetical protein
MAKVISLDTACKLATMRCAKMAYARKAYQTDLSLIETASLEGKYKYLAYSKVELKKLIRAFQTALKELE